MQSEPVPIPFFFDDENPKTGFDFVYVSSKHKEPLSFPPILISNLIIKSRTHQPLNQGVFALHSGLLAFYKV